MGSGNFIYSSPVQLPLWVVCVSPDSQELSHLSCFSLYWVIYERAGTGWSRFTALLLYSGCSALFVDCLISNTSESWESDFS